MVSLPFLKTSFTDPENMLKNLSEKGSLTITYWPKVLNNALNTSMTDPFAFYALTRRDRVALMTF
jgi:hypothetical protein